MKKFIICLSIVVIIVCGGFLYSYFTKLPDTNVDLDGEKYYLSWDAYPEAVEYEVFFDGQLLTTQDTKIDITQYLIEDKKYDVVVKTTTVQDGEVVVHEEDYDYKAQLKSDFKRKTFFMNGNVYDYNIETLKEYEIFVWYNILYRKSESRFYSSCSSINIANIGRLTLDYINSYPEYPGVKDSNRYGVKEGRNIYKVCNLSYYLPNDYTTSVANCTPADSVGLYEYKQDKTQYTKVASYNQPYEKAETTTERTFPIDAEGKKEVVVYNSEQLFMATQYGARPVFGAENTVAETIYNNAREVLAEINNSDTLTDYQKTLNIYRYICMNVTYDHILFDYMAYIGDSTVRTFGKYSPFYLEGVFYDMDNQVAVCDGLSKAFVLMCRIEGIDATKVNGFADGEGVIRYQDGTYSGGAHAWNKVRLNGNTYLVDTTWGVIGYNNQEFLTHDYFLISKENLKLTSGLYTHVETYAPDTTTAVSYEYYKNSNIGGYSLYVENVTQLKNIANYMKNNNISNVEIKLSPTYITQIQYSSASVGAYIKNNFPGFASGFFVDDLCLIIAVNTTF